MLGAPGFCLGVIRERVEAAEFAACSQEVQGFAPSSGHSALLDPGLRCLGHRRRGGSSRQVKPPQGVCGFVSWDQLEQSLHLHCASASSWVKWLARGLQETLQMGQPRSPGPGVSPVCV